jgi:hypothetical protein
MSSVSESRVTFSVMDGSTMVFTARSGRSWVVSPNFPHVYASFLTTAGTYTITVSGPAAATSPSFASAPARRLRGRDRKRAQLLPGRRDGRPTSSPPRRDRRTLNDQNAMAY